MLCHNLFLSYINYYRQRSHLKRFQLKITLLQILLSGTLNGSILGPILNRKSIYTARNSIEELIKLFEKESKSVIDWFKMNDMIRKSK